MRTIAGYVVQCRGGTWYVSRHKDGPALFRSPSKYDAIRAARIFDMRKKRTAARKGANRTADLLQGHAQRKGD